MPPPPPPPPLPPSSQNSNDQNSSSKSRLRSRPMPKDGSINAVKSFDLTKLKATQINTRNQDGKVITEKRSANGTFEKVQCCSDDQQVKYYYDVEDDNFELGQIRPNLFLGTQDPARDFYLMKHYGITHILDLARLMKTFPFDFEYLSVDLMEVKDCDILSQLDTYIKFIENATRSMEGKVFVHCNAGISCAPFVVAAYIMKQDRLTVEAALEQIQSICPYIRPKTYFIEVLNKCEKIVLES